MSKVNLLIKELNEKGYKLSEPFSHTTKAGVELVKRNVRFNTDKGWSSLEFVFESEISVQYTEKLPSSSNDGMRSEYSEHNITKRSVYENPSIQKGRIGRSTAFNEHQAFKYLQDVEILSI